MQNKHKKQKLKRHLILTKNYTKNFNTKKFTVLFKNWEPNTNKYLVRHVAVKFDTLS